MRFQCAHCGKWTDKPAGAVNRARAQGLRLFCGRRCSGLGRRKHKTKAQRVEEKRIYDAQYRRINLARIKERKKAYHKANYDPAKQRAYNQRRMPYHVEYCRRPEYRRYKREYDRQLRASEYGPFAEAYMLTINLNREIKGRMSNHEIKWQNQTANKTQFRRRESAEEPERSRKRPRQRRHGHSTSVGQ
jgi:hypothetical protein